MSYLTIQRVQKVQLFYEIDVQLKSGYDLQNCPSESTIKPYGNIRSGRSQKTIDYVRACVAA